MNERISRLFRGTVDERAIKNDRFCAFSTRPPGRPARTFDEYTPVVYYKLVITIVELSRQAQRELTKVPRHVAIKLQEWVEHVEDMGLEEARKSPGYHDEPLKGALKGMRSVRLSRSYRAYYRVVQDTVEFVRVERVDKHEY